MSAHFKPTASIKLVIWDLDDTFWEGTLSEGGVTLIERNIEIVKTLVDRGIMSSIVSKNDMEPVKRVLTEASIWDYFIFPKISWGPKGSLIDEIIEEANLRPDNVLFIDDNSINIEEARFRFPTLMTAYPEDVLPHLLDLKEAAGKDDSAHSRLNQYKQLEKKVVDRAQSALSNVEFLRQCDIKLRFEFDVEKHLDRIVELINRSNQLNYTKLRIEGEEAREAFLATLKRHDIFAAGIFASDRYGSHGLIGFYMQHKNERVNELVHYVWSCRMMNAGLEQYVYEQLCSPIITVVAPVSNPIVVFDTVDWITEVQSDTETSSAEAPRLLMIGSCDLTAVASYCSSNREEFVNGVKDGVMTRYDDFGFVLGDSAKIEASKALKQMPAWSAEEFMAFHYGLAVSDVIIVSLSAAMKGLHCVTQDGVVVRVHPEGLGHHIDFDPRASFLDGCTFYAHTVEQKIDLLARSLAKIDQTAPSSKRGFLLGANTRDVDGVLSDADRALLLAYNAACQTFCEGRPGWDYVSIDDVVAVEELLDDRHYTRMGYFSIAKHINEMLLQPQAKAAAPVLAPAFAKADLLNLIRAGRRASRLTTFGGDRTGILPYIKQAVKLTPLSGLARTLLGKRQGPLELSKLSR